MPVDPKNAAMAMADGLSAVCATCTKYWEAKDKGLSGCNQPECRGPIGGGVFKDYDGPLKDALARICFVCGSPSKYGIKVSGFQRIIGACKDHISYVRDYKSESGSDKMLSVAGDNAFDPYAKKKKTLFEAMAEFEATGK